MSASSSSPETSPLSWHGTTILTVRKGGKVVVAGDGQVSLGQTIIKGTARKVRRVGAGQVIAGFAGSTADAFTLFERLETKLERFPDQLKRACVELAKDWRTDRYLRRLEAMMIVADPDESLVLTGTGDVLEPDNAVMGIGSGGMYALAAAKALLDSGLDAEQIARKAMAIAAQICVYTNDSLTVETIDATAS
ncbi:ATP-dependent protease subunit HslV [Methyloceanibacter stevinii]|uniref:ATP-dependent protease subunit HslV n=1 Tax=Methyloceanibacter stevinii TaxID=1774970 RepID=A0A1E3VQM4_9HYPH|nr:ATP-dependent protease subunit HslV [Methyloceanibacter stevinii]ODR95828.1 ATP-dependent protease subunit HslV [Methyloceanibacter stevinii]